MRQQCAGLGYTVGHGDFVTGVRKTPINECNAI